jgi:hypothetical protein
VLTPDECQRQVQRILKSATFRNSSTLQQLLQFLGTKAFEPGAETLKEYTIGVEAFGRSADFDPKTDTIVRVQIHRLRQKLTEYYESDGSRDQIILEIPKGHYVPAFQAAASRDKGFVGTAEATSSSMIPIPAHGAQTDGKGELADGSQARREFSQRVGRNAAIAVIVILGFVAGFLIRGRMSDDQIGSSSRFADSSRDANNDPVKAFWSNFVGNDPAPIIAYPDAVFLLDDWNDLFRFRRGASDDRGSIVDPHLAQQFASNPALVAKAGQLYYENGYTGAGELKGVAMLSNLFGQMGVKATIKPSRDLTPDDLRQHNVILIGSPFQNVAVAQLTPPADFSFDNPDSHHEQWRAQIINAHPQANEESSYRTERDPITRALKADYCLITVEQGVVPGRYIAILGGLDTTGTEGAILFATSKQGVDDFSKVLSSPGKPSTRDETPLFQALVKVQLDKGYGVLGADLVALHRMPASGGHVAGNEPTQSLSH